MNAPLDEYIHRGCHIPRHIHKAIRAYVDDHRRPGEFLQAVIRNDLMDATARADSENLPNIVAIIGYFHNETPGTCWGSKEALEAWVKETEEVAMTRDQERRLDLMKRGMHVPNNIGPLKDVRWSARDDDWYIETEEGEVHWWNGKRWAHCPQGAR